MRTSARRDIALAASATDATSGVASVAFQVKPTETSSFTTVDADTSGTPFTGSWSPAPGKPDGPVELRVAITDVAGNGPTYSGGLRFTLDRTNPVVDAGRPDPGLRVGRSRRPAPPTSPRRLRLSNDGGSTWTPIATGNGPSPYSAAWTTPLTDGSYQVRATAIDGGGNQGSDMKAVQVDRTGPTGGLTQPAAAATVGGSSVSVAASASDPGGSGVASVTFRYRPAGEWRVHDARTDTTSPYSCSGT